MEKCVICDVDTLKYRCPQCMARYCSVSCCKTHKAKCEGISQTSSVPPSSQPAVSSTNNPPTVHVPNYPLWTADVKSKQFPVDTDEHDAVSDQRLGLLRENIPVVDMLRNPHLRAICENLVNSENPSLELAKAMQEPIFTELADQCLRVVDPNNPHLHPADTSMEDDI